MTGCQQIDKLIRKNLLLKARRPIGSFCELLLPLTLFIFLAVIRKEYESQIWYFREQRFDNRAIFPQTRRLVEITEGLSSLGSNTSTGSFNFNQLTDAEKAGMASVGFLSQQLLCNWRFQKQTEEIFSKILGITIPFTGGRTLAEHIMDADAFETAQSVGQLVHTLQTTDIDRLVNSGDGARDLYFSSGWAQQLEEAADYFDKELTLLKGDLNSSRLPDSTDPVQRRVETWINDTCHLRGPVFDNLNTTGLAQNILNLQQMAEQMGVWDLLQNEGPSQNETILEWFDDYLESVNNSLVMYGIDQALKAMSPSEMRTWLMDLRQGMDQTQPMDWFNKTLDAISSTEVRNWLSDLRDALDAAVPMGDHLNRTLERLDTPAARTWLSSLGRALNTTLGKALNTTDPARLLNETLNRIDTPEHRNSLNTWLRHVVRAMDGANGAYHGGRLSNHVRAPTQTWAREGAAHLQRLLNYTVARLEALEIVPTHWGSLDDLANMITWISHFAYVDTPLAKVLSVGQDLIRLLRGDTTKTEQTLGKLLADILPKQYADNTGGIERGQVVDASRKARSVIGRLIELLNEDDRHGSLREAVHRAFDEADFGKTLRGYLHDAAQKVTRDGTLLQQAEDVLREVGVSEEFIQEMVDLLDEVDLSKNLTHEVHTALEQANISDILRSELAGLLERQANWSSSLSREFVDTLMQANMSNLRLEMAHVVAKADLARNFDTQVTTILQEVRGAIALVDDSVVGLRDSLEDMLGNATAEGWLPSTLREAMGDVRNLTAQEIERDLFPTWKDDWRRECLKISVSEVTDMLRKHEGVVEAIDVNITKTVLEAHSQLRGVDHEMLRTAKDFLRDAQRHIQHLNHVTLSRDLFKWLRRAKTMPRWRWRWERAPLNERMARILIAYTQGELVQQGVDCTLPGHSSVSWLGSLLGSSGNVVSVDVRRDQAPKDNNGKTQGPTKAEAYFQNEMLRRKILVAPYKGDVRELWELFMVELIVLVTNTETGAVDNEFIREFMDSPLVRGPMASVVNNFLQDMMLTFPNERELEKYAVEHPDDVFAAVVFRSADQETGNFDRQQLDISYALRVHAQLLPSTDRVIRWVRFSLFGGVGKAVDLYSDIGFSYVQDTLGRAAARFRAKREAASVQEVRRLRDGPVPSNDVYQNAFANRATDPLRRLAVSLEQFPSPSFRVDRFIYLIQFMMPMLMVLGWIYSISLLVKEMVYEKQERLREVMRIQGLRTWVYWASWIVFAMCQLTIMVLFAVIILCGSNVLQYSNPVAVFAFFFVYSGAVVSFSMLISACFIRAKVAAVCAGVSYFTLYLPYNVFNRFEEMTSLGVKCLYCLCCPTGLGIGASIISKWEVLEEGLQWSNMGKVPSITNSGALPNNNFTLLHVVGMLFLDMFLYQMAAWYIEKVFPGELGLPQPWYFPFMPSYWRSQNVSLPYSSSWDNPEKDDNTSLDVYEAAPEGLTAAVRIRKLVKVFSAGKRALNGISLDMHQGTILGLLGHNGAGKSTTMSILTGLYPPTEGDVLVHGTSIRKDSPSVRKQLGVCLQHNALYEVVTVREHLDLFCNLKSVPRKEVPKSVQDLLEDIGLSRKRDAQTKALSGGMKRKLSIGIALAGGSKVIALDEPTAGVDATSRRDIWQLLARYKKDRAILLSTHFMDEADVLSDRIAIIAEGRLTAIGSSINLKRHFADRYLLTIVASDGVDPIQLLTSVRKVVPGATCIGSRGREYSYALQSRARSHFAGLFAFLEDPDERKRLGVETYGLSAPSMEEVFLMASSLHEEGLHGRVRNNTMADGALSPPSDTASTASGSRPHSSSSAPSLVLKDDDGFNNEAAETSSNLSPASDLSPDRGAAGMDTAEPRPFSPQCISALHFDAVKEVEVSADPDKLKLGKEVQPNNEDSVVSEIHTPMLRGARLLQQQFRARFRTRAISAFRDRRAWASQILLPSIFVLLALGAATILEVVQDEPPLKLDTSMFIGGASGSRSSTDEHIIPIWASHGGDASLTTDVVSAFDQAKMANDRLVQLHDPAPAFDDGAGVMRDYILENKKAMRARSYGAVNVDSNGQYANVTLFYDNRGAHITPVMLHLCNNARLRLLGYGDTRTEVWNHPLPMTQQLIEDQLNSNNQAIVSFLVAVTVLLAMGFIPASFIVYIVHEKATNAKHQQLLTGVSPVMYWVSTYAWDIVNCCAPVLFMFTLFLGFQLDAYSGPNALAVLLALLTYGLAMTPQMYCMEPFFVVPSTAYVVCIVVNIFTGFVSLQLTTVMTLLEPTMPHLKPLNSFCESLFMWTLPNYCLGRSFMEIATNHYIRFAAEEFGTCLGNMKCSLDALDWEVSGKFIFVLFVTSLMWFCIRLLIEWRCFLRCCLVGHEVPGSRSGLEDSDVTAEAERVASLLQGNGSEKGSLVISNLSKTFKRVRWSCCRRRVEAVHSVRGVNLTVEGGECFGLLGVNGAGKTTTMRMITGHIEVGNGDVRLSGHSVRTNRDQARRHLGYCPQFDALTDKLTTREALNFYARIRGVPADCVKAVVEKTIKRMCLEAHQNRLCQHLSGGNRRKLSTALALIGEPDVVLLDEPSTGVDVGARRFLWDIIGEVRKHGHAVVLTSHSMDECEVLCTRLTIMVAGEMRCLGTPLQLKSKYGGGYTLAIKAQQAQQGDSLPALAQSLGDEKSVPEAVKQALEEEAFKNQMRRRIVSLDDLEDEPPIQPSASFENNETNKVAEAEEELDVAEECAPDRETEEKEEQTGKETESDRWVPEVKEASSRTVPLDGEVVEEKEKESSKPRIVPLDGVEVETLKKWVVSLDEGEEDDSGPVNGATPWEDPAESIRNFMSKKVPDARMAEENVGLFRYRLGGEQRGKDADQTEVPLADLFKKLERAMASNGSLERCVLDYTVSQTSLEEVFLHFSQL